MIGALIKHIKMHGFKLTWCKLFHSFTRSEFIYKSIKRDWCNEGGNYDYIATYHVNCNCGCSYEYSLLLLGNNDLISFGSDSIEQAKIKAMSMTRKQLVGK